MTQRRSARVFTFRMSRRSPVATRNMPPSVVHSAVRAHVTLESHCDTGHSGRDFKGIVVSHAGEKRTPSQGCAASSPVKFARAWRTGLTAGRALSRKDQFADVRASTEKDTQRSAYGAGDTAHQHPREHQRTPPTRASDSECPAVALADPLPTGSCGRRNCLRFTRDPCSFRRRCIGTQSWKEATSVAGEAAGRRAWDTGIHRHRNPVEC